MSRTFIVNWYIIHLTVFHFLCYRGKDRLMIYWCIVNITMCYITLQMQLIFKRNMRYTCAVSSLIQLKPLLFYGVLWLLQLKFQLKFKCCILGSHKLKLDIGFCFIMQSVMPRKTVQKNMNKLKFCWWLALKLLSRGYIFMSKWLIVHGWIWHMLKMSHVSMSLAYSG